MTTLHTRLLLLVGVTALFAGIVPASAATTTTIAMQSGDEIGHRYLPGAPIRTVGASFRWQNPSDNPHTATRTTAPIVWDFDVPPGQTSPAKQMQYAGSYYYRCQVHTAMDGRLRIRPRITRSTDGSGNYRLTLATEFPSGTRRFEVQRRLGNGDWQLWKNNITTMGVRFTIQGAATNSFRARLFEGESAMSEWSPAASVDPDPS